MEEEEGAMEEHKGVAIDLTGRPSRGGGVWVAQWDTHSVPPAMPVSVYMRVRVCVCVCACVRACAGGRAGGREGGDGGVCGRACVCAVCVV